MTAIPYRLWIYRAKLVRVVDGDTLDVYWDMGRHTYVTERLRLLGVNAPEVHGATKLAGDAATAFVTEWLRVGKALDEWPLVLETAKSDAFGRFLATVWRVADGACLNEDLLAAHQAVPFAG